MQCDVCQYEYTMREAQAGVPCPRCEDRRKASAGATVRTSAPGNAGHPVVVVDIEMPFGSMVRFMVKWVLATIPAAIILAILAWGFLSIARLLFG